MQSEMKIRFTPAQKAWLVYRAMTENRSQAAALIQLLEKEMKDDPLKVFVHECHLYGDTYFGVSIGEFGDDFFKTEYHDEDGRELAYNEALARARDKAQELGLGRNAIALHFLSETEDFMIGEDNDGDDQEEAA